MPAGRLLLGALLILPSRSASVSGLAFYSSALSRHSQKSARAPCCCRRRGRTNEPLHLDAVGNRAAMESRGRDDAEQNLKRSSRSRDSTESDVPRLTVVHNLGIRPRMASHRSRSCLARATTSNQQFCAARSSATVLFRWLPIIDTIIDEDRFDCAVCFELGQRSIYFFKQFAVSLSHRNADPRF